MNKSILKLWLPLFLSGLLSAGCKKDGNSFDFASDGGGSGQVVCEITNTTPNSNTLKVSSIGSTSTTFTVGLSDSTCDVKFKLNGSPITASGGTTNVLSSQLNPGSNTLTAEVGTTKREWTVTKNSAPTCSSQTPATNGNSMGPGSPLILTGHGADGDGDPLNFSWTVNDASVGSSILNTFIGATSSQATFVPTSSYLGVNSVKMLISDGLDSTTCSWNVGVAGSCSIAGTTPAAPGPVRVAYAAGTSTNFQVSTDPGCLITWTLNGTPLAATTATVPMVSGDLMVGSNFLQVTVTNGTSTETKNWAVVRNSPPICVSQTPGSTGNTLGVGSNINLSAIGSDLNGDTLSFTWRDNGNLVNTSHFAITNGANTSSALFTPIGMYVGANQIKATISDSWDAVDCTWDVQVVPSCAVVSSTPSAATIRVANNGGTLTSFVAVPNDSSCVLSWTLNGSPLAGSSAFQTIASSAMTGTNTVEATLSNGFSTATRTWTVNKNTPPTCDVQMPAAGTSTVGVNNPIVLKATGADAESDPMTYAWKNNGVTVNPAHFAVTTPSGSGQAVFTPNSSYLGVNTVQADINDGFDTRSCMWTVNVLSGCTVSSSLPAGTNSKIAYLGTTSNAFGVVPNDSACAVSWNLNGSPLPGGNFLSVNSSDFSDGPASNTLTATLDNGYTAPSTRSWTVIKNRVPQCSSQTPVANPPGMVYGNTQNFTSVASDADGDTISNYTWRFNGVTSGTLFTPINTTGNTSVATFRPTLTNVGTSHSITASFQDGYDAGMCSWTMDVIDPNTVNITSCTPSASPVVLHSTGGLADQTLTANATGNGLVYTWYKNGTLQSGFSTPTFNISSSSMPVGPYTFKGKVDDAYGNTAECNWTVKVNAKPALSSPLPDPTITRRMNYNMTQSFSVSASDGNGDPLVYNWTLDGLADPDLPSGSASTTYSPGGLFSALGAHVVSVTVTDGTESTTQSWNVEVNLFSDPCNTMMNSSVAVAGGHICTLVGSPTIGNGAIPSADQTQMRVRPAYMTDDGSGNYIFTDQLNHSVNVFNRSGSGLVMFGTTIPAGRMQLVMGNGANGLTSDNLYRTQFKLNLPMDVAYDSSNGRLYVADFYNHRVAMMDNTGLVTTVLGLTGSGTNNSSTNTDGNQGNTHVCTNPVGLRLVNFGGNKWLYVACSGTHTIKRMDADSTGGNFGKTYVVVGRLASGVSSAGNVDGPAGPSGDAYVNNPWALSDDGQGNIYWNESGGSLRVRMATTGGSAKSFFTLGYTPSYAFGIGATDIAGALTAGSFNTQATTPSGTATQVAIDGPSSVITAACLPMRARILNASNTVAALGAGNTIQLAGTGGSLAFYSDSSCLSALPSNQLSMSTGDTQKDFYFKKTTAGASTLTATGTGLTSQPAAGISIAVGASGTPGILQVRGPGTYDYTQCMRYTVQVQTSGGQASLAGSTRTIRMNNNATGNFYTDSACATTPQVQFTIPAGQSEIFVYFARTVVAPSANYVVSLFGNINNNGANPASSYPSANVPTSVGLVTNRVPRGLAVWAPGGVMRGIFENNWDNNRTIFVNTSNVTSYTIGGATAPPNQGVVVVGTNTAGFNADGLATSARTYDNYGLNLNQAQDTLLFPDYDNYRVRTVDLSTANGNITTLIGAGRSRSGNLGDSPTPAQLMYFNQPSQVLVDNSLRKLYVSDSGNGRIRRVDLLTGYVDTMIGKGVGPGNIENEDPTNVLLQSPRAMTLMTSGASSMLVYADQSANTGNNMNCQIRAYNMSLTNDVSNFFNVAIPRNRVSSLAGDYLSGCQSWTSAPAGSAGVGALTTKLYNPEGLTTDGTNLYFAAYNDNCIIKITPSGQLYPVVGTCSTTQGTLDGNTTIATLALPTSVLIDPAYASDGNMFITDALTANPSRVRYVNYRTSPVTIGSSTIPAAPGGGVGIVQTLWTVSPSGNSSGRIYGLAAFANQICFSGGAPGDGGTGSHNVTCYDRSSPLGAVTLRVGPNEASGVPTRGGAPIDTSQENLLSSSALVNAPYGLSFDSGGNLYISERNNHIVRLVRRWW